MGPTAARLCLLCSGILKARTTYVVQRSDSCLQSLSTRGIAWLVPSLLQRVVAAVMPTYDSIFYGILLFSANHMLTGVKHPPFGAYDGLVGHAATTIIVRESKNFGRYVRVMIAPATTLPQMLIYSTKRCPASSYERVCGGGGAG